MADGDLLKLDEYFDASKAVRRVFEGQWLLNLSYHDGRQWVSFNGRQVHEIDLPDWKAKLVDNRIRGLVRKEIARMTKTRPVWVGVPTTSDDAEIDAARLRQRLFEHDWQYLDMARKRRAAQQWSRICGAGFLKITWDSGKGPGLDVYVRDGKAVKDSNGFPITPQRLQDQGLQQLVTDAQTQNVQMGDPCVNVRTPFECFPDPLAGEDGLESCRRFGEEVVHDPDYLSERFGQRLEPDANATAGILQARFSGLGGDSGKKRGVKVREFWALPCEDYPEGAYIVYAPGTKTLLANESLPYPWLPYVMFRGQPRPGSFWPAGIDDLISPQTELNKSLSQIEENASRIGNPPLMVPSSADTEIEGLPGEIVEFQDTGSPNARPEFLSVPELPGYVQSRPDRAENSLREISHQHEVTSGQVPAGVTAAAAISMLQEADDTVLGPDIEDMELTIRDAGRRLLWLRWKFCSDERMIRIAGEDDQWDIVAFRGQMLKNGGQNDEVQAGSGIPQSKAAKQAAIERLLTLFVQNGVPVSERDLRRVLRDFDVGGLENMLANIERDERQIAEENRRLFAGDSFDINAFDNDVLHISGHEDAQKRPEWQKLSPQVQAQVEAHVEAHRQRQATKEMAAMPQPPGGPQLNGGGPPGAAAALPPGAPPDGAQPAPAGP